MYSFNKIASLIAFAIIILGFSMALKAQNPVRSSTKVVLNVEGVTRVFTFPNCGNVETPKRLLLNDTPYEFTGEIVTVDIKLGYGTRLILEQGDCAQSLTIR